MLINPPEREDKRGRQVSRGTWQYPKERGRGANPVTGRAARSSLSVSGAGDNRPRREMASRYVPPSIGEKGLEGDLEIRDNAR